MSRGVPRCPCAGAKGFPSLPIAEHAIKTVGFSMISRTVRGLHIAPWERPVAPCSTPWSTLSPPRHHQERPRDPPWRSKVLFEPFPKGPKGLQDPSENRPGPFPAPFWVPQAPRTPPRRPRGFLRGSQSLHRCSPRPLKSINCPNQNVLMAVHELQSRS